VCAKLRVMVRSPFPLLLLLTATALTGCSASLFKVKPVTELPPLPGNVKTADAGGVLIKVAPLLTDEECQDLFEANLPLNGVLPLRLALDFQSDLPLDLKHVRFRLRDSQGREWKLLPPKKAVSRILKANGITAYNPSGRKQFAQDLGAYALDLGLPLSSSDSHRTGFLFFQTPDKRPVESSQQLTLTVERLPTPVTITVN
jgi:hypothetical protein